MKPATYSVEQPPKLYQGKHYQHVAGNDPSLCVSENHLECWVNCWPPQTREMWTYQSKSSKWPERQLRNWNIAKEADRAGIILERFSLCKKGLTLWILSVRWEECRARLFNGILFLQKRQWE